MRKSGKKALSLLLALVLVLGMLPEAALAADGDVPMDSAGTEEQIFFPPPEEPGSAQELAQPEQNPETPEAPESAPELYEATTYPVTGGDLYFDPDTGTITDCDKTVTSADIPSNINGVAVTSIRWNAFQGCSGLTNVTIPGSVTSIGGFAFYGCTSLTSMTIPGSVTSIGGWAFQSCTGLTSVTIGNGVASIGREAFSNCSGLTSVTIPGSVTRIGEGPFRDCLSLTAILVDAGSSAYSSSGDVLFTKDGKTLVAYPGGKSGSYTIPSGVTTIADLAFAFCRKLTGITIPGSVTNIGDGAFESCETLPAIQVDTGNPAYTSVDGVLFTKDGKTLVAFPSGKSTITYAIPDGVTGIGNYAFSYCNSLTGVTIPSRVTSIGDWAFFGCHNLTSVTIPGNVTSIGKQAFSYCRALTRVTIGNGVTSIGDWAFEGCTALTDVYYGGSEAQWNAIKGNFRNDLTNATIHYNSSGGTVNSYTVTYTLGGGSGGPSTQNYIAGATVTIPDTVPVKDGYTFGGWSDGAGATYQPGGSFTMPDHAVTLTAIWSAAPPPDSGKIPVLSTNSADVLSMALKQADLTNLFQNVTCDVGKLRGPEISIAGLTFNLFECDANLELPFKDLSVEASVNHEKKTVNVLIGFKEVKGDMTIIGDPNSSGDSRNDFWKSYTDAKELYKTFGGKSVTSAAFRGKFQDVYDRMQELEMDMIVGAKGKVCGYVEFSYESGKLEFSEGGAILSVSMSVTENGRIPSFPLAYVTLRFGVSAEGELKVVANDDGWLFDPAFDAALTAAIGVGLGKNSGQFQAYVEGGFDGELGAHIRPMWKVTHEDLFSVDMTGNLYLSWKLKAWILEDGDTYKKQLVKLGLFPRLELLSDLDSGPLSMEDLLASARPVTRDYLYTPSLMAVTDDYSFSKVEYPYAEPALLRLRDNRLLMVWVGDSGQKADADRTSIFYSIYDNAAWSTPAAIHESGTYTDHPVVYQDGGNVYALWMQADTQLENMDAQEAFRHLDLMVSSFDGNAWSNPLKISEDNTLAETDYALAAKDGTIAVAWIENSNNDMFMGSGTNTIYLKTCTNGSWDETGTVYSSTDPITGVDVDLNAGVQLSWSVTSGETTTTYVRDASGTLQTSDGGGRDARWSSGSRYELRGTELYRDGAATGLSGLSNFEIVSSGAQTAVLTLVPTGLTCELYGSYYNAGSKSWGPLVQLTGFKKYIRSYSAVLDESGRLVAALNLVNVDVGADQVYDNTTAQLVVVDDCQYSDLVVEDWISYDNDLAAPGGTLPLSFQVTNNSMETLTSVTASANGQSQTVSCLLPAGESAVLTMNYALPSSLSEQEVRLTVTPDYSKEESNTANNTASVRIGMADLETVIAAPESNAGDASVNIQVKNKGYTAAENVLLKVYRSNSGGEVLCEQNLGQIMAGKSAAYTFQLPDELLFVDDPETMNALSCEVTSDTEERTLANNADRVAFGNLLPMQVSAAVGADSVQFSVSLEGGETGFSDSMIVLALYDAKDKMLSVRSETESVSPGGDKTVTFTIDRGQDLNAARAKVFWTDWKNTPITRAWTGSYPAGT